MYKVLVLMSTYNGQKYIERQIDSILNQENVSIELLIRDDGSSDNTVEIIHKMSQVNKNIKLYCGNNLGFTYSFYDLINHASGYDFYAFSDQDDIWHNNKIHDAIIKMSNEYILYASNMTIVDENLNKLGILYSNFNYERNLLIKCFPFYNPFGCTIVWKDSLQRKLYNNLPNLRVPHDLWIHIVASFNGKVYIDQKPQILHRIHGENACGIGRNFITRLKKLKKFYLSNFRITTDKTLSIAIEKYGLDNFSEIDKQFLQLILMYKKSLLNKFKLYFSENFKSIKLQKRLEFLFLILVNKF